MHRAVSRAGRCWRAGRGMGALGRGCMLIAFPRSPARAPALLPHHPYRPPAQPLHNTRPFSSPPLQLRVHRPPGGAGQGALRRLEQAVWAGAGPQRGAADGRGAGRPEAAGEGAALGRWGRCLWARGSSGVPRCWGSQAAAQGGTASTSAKRQAVPACACRPTPSPPLLHSLRSLPALPRPPQGNIVIATPEHWDMLSRRWKQRKAVQVGAGWAGSRYARAAVPLLITRHARPTCEGDLVAWLLTTPNAAAPVAGRAAVHCGRDAPAGRPARPRAGGGEGEGEGPVRWLEAELWNSWCLLSTAQAGTSQCFLSLSHPSPAPPPRPRSSRAACATSPASWSGPSASWRSPPRWPTPRTWGSGSAPPATASSTSRPVRCRTGWGRGGGGWGWAAGRRSCTAVFDSSS